MTSRSFLRLAAGLALAVAALAATGCSYEWLFPETRLTTVHPETDATRLILDVYRPVTWIMVVIFVVVESLLIYAVLRFRRRPGDDSLPEQVHGNTAMEIGWTLIPVVIVVMLTFPTLRNLWALATPPEGDDVLVVKVVGKQWWWEFHYPEAMGVITANELHVPVDTPVRLDLTSDNVIHSFWVPRLSGKRDLVPGRTQSIWFTPERVGEYYGQCAELCGASHGLMKFRVYVDEPGTFAAWVANERSAIAGSLSDPGPAAMLASGCVACHKVDFPGSPFMQRLGPILTHVGARTTIAGGILDNTPENMTRWIKYAPTVKPGSTMPCHRAPTPEDPAEGCIPVSEETIQTIVAYLDGLK